ncbi:MAG: hypothetical protein ACI4OW_02060 [Alphaproteobacteria bacterium]
MNENQEQTAKKARLLLNRYCYYSSQNRQSEFETLPGHIRGAVEREARFQIDSLIKSQTFIPYLNEENVGELFAAHCEYYAHKGLEQHKINPYNPNNYFNILMERDSRAIYNQDDRVYEERRGNQSVKTSRTDYKTSRHAASIDREAERIRKSSGSYNPEQKIAAMLSQKEIRLR